MERPPARPEPERGRPSDARTPPRPPPQPEPERGASLPPWSSFGLGSEIEAPGPVPADETAQAASGAGGGTVPDDLIAPGGSRGWIVAVLVACLLLVGALSYVIVRTDWVTGQRGAGTPAAALAAAGSRSRTPTAASAAATATRGATAAVHPTSAPAAAAAPTATATAAIPILVAADGTTVEGVGATSVAAGVKAALAGVAAGRPIEVVGAERRGGADVVVGATAPGQGYQSKAVVSSYLALVTSPRLPLYGVGQDAAARLIAGQANDWRQAGAPLGLKAEPLALQGQVPPGMTPAATFASYDALVTGLEQHPGGFALVPVGQVDARVSVLAIAGADPLRGVGDLAHYPYAQRLYVGVRDGLAATWQPTLDAALKRLGLPRAEPGVTSIGIAGDIVPGRGVHRKMVQYNDFSHPFRAVAGELAAYDLTFANLEGDLSATIPQPGDAHSGDFVSDPKMIAGMKLAGIDCVNLANNHVMRFGQQGLSDTMAALNAAGMPYVGAGENLDAARRAQTFKVHGVTVALLGINGVSANPDPSLPGAVQADDAATADTPGTNPLVPDQYLADIKAAAAQGDVVIPYFAMGVENTSLPPSWVVQTAHAAIDAGAALVVATHPHWIQGIELYKGKPIVYSLGNFVFDQEFSVQVRQGMILEVTLRGKQIAGLRVHGVEIEDFNQPRPMTTAEQASFLDRLWELTDRLNAEIKQIG